MDTFPLASSWVFWAHLPHNANWDLHSYISIMELTNVKEAIGLVEQLHPELVENCMLFLMKKGISPRWEDAENVHGGGFSYKISNNLVCHLWKKLMYALICNRVSDDTDFMSHVNGITISPKKNFCVINIWMKSCQYQNASLVSESLLLPRQGCLFKKHDERLKTNKQNIPPTKKVK